MNSIRVFPIFEDHFLEENIKGVTISVSVIQIPPMVSILRNSNGTIEAIEGYLADIWYLLEQQLNFTTNLIDAGPEFIGSNNNGTWNGMIGSLQSGKVDVGLVNFGMKLTRKLVVDFSAAVHSSESKLIIFQKENIELINWMTFVTVFSWEVWISIGVLWVVFSVFLGFTSKLELKAAIMDQLFYLLAALIQQGGHKVSNNISSRIAVIWYWTMSVLIYASFTALLTTELTASTNKPLSNLKEALELGYKVSVAKGTYQHLTILQNANMREYQIIIRMLNDNPSLIVNSIQEGIETTFDRKTLFYADETALRFKASQNCSFSILNSGMEKRLPTYLGFSKDFKFKEIINRRIIQILSTGIADKLLRRWIPLSHECRGNNNGFLSLGLTKTSFAFAALIGGIICSIILFTFEICFKKFGNKKHIDNNKYFTSVF